MIYFLIAYFLCGGWIAYWLWHMATHWPKSGKYREPASALQWVVIITFFLLWGPLMIGVIVWGLFAEIRKLFTKAL